jgi:hypothetical protein
VRRRPVSLTGQKASSSRIGNRFAFNHSKVRPTSPIRVVALWGLTPVGPGRRQYRCSPLRVPSGESAMGSPLPAHPEKEHYQRGRRVYQGLAYWEGRHPKTRRRRISIERYAAWSQYQGAAPAIPRRLQKAIKLSRSVNWSAGHKGRAPRAISREPLLNPCNRGGYPTA